MAYPLDFYHISDHLNPVRRHIVHTHRRSMRIADIELVPPSTRALFWSDDSCHIDIST